MASTQVIKGKCSRTGKCFALEVEQQGGTYVASNFIELTEDVAGALQSTVAVESLESGDNLIPCAICGSRTVFGCSCNITRRRCAKADPYDFQCMYCEFAAFDLPVCGNLWLVLDVSASMRGAKNLPVDQTPMEKAKASAAGMVRNLPAGLKVGVVTFGGSVQELLEPTADRRRVVSTIEGLCPTGGTQEPLSRMVKKLLGQGQAALTKQHILILTDGRWSREEQALSAAEKLKEAGVEICAIGFGSANEAFLGTVVTSTDLNFMTDVGGLTDAFERVARHLNLRTESDS